MAELALMVGTMLDVAPDQRRPGLYILTLGGDHAR
jgi:hypothetical protein